MPIITDVKNSFLHGLALEWFRKGGLEPRRHHACSSLPARLQLAAIGLGVAIGPPTVAAREVAAGTLRLVASSPALPSLDYFIAIAGGAPSPAVRIVRDLAREAISEEPSFHIAAEPQLRSHRPVSSI